jgi:predicted ATP-grasp superfamily ATP-dependent carboligase
MMPSGNFGGLSASTSKMIMDIFDYCENTPINKSMHKAALQQIVNDHIDGFHIDIVLMMLEKRKFITINDSFTFTFNIKS